MKTLVVLLAAAASMAAQVTPQTQARTIKYGDSEISQINCALNYTTTVVLADEEVVVKSLVGIPDNIWVVDKVGTNAVYVSPAIGASPTNLILIGRSGRHYVFLLTVSPSPDIMVYIKLKEGLADSSFKQIRLYTEGEVAVYEKRLAEMTTALAKSQSAVELANQKADRKVELAKVALPKSIGTYRFKQNVPPFFIQKMIHDGRFTYITANPDEMPAVYEERDGKPNLVDCPYEDNMYVCGRVLRSGYFAMGKEKMKFESQ